MNEKIFGILMIILLIPTLISATLISSTDFTNGLVIEGNNFNDVVVNSNFTFNFNIFDKETGVLTDNATCYYNLYQNDIFDDGVYSSAVTQDIFKYQITKNINKSGSYILGIRCDNKHSNITTKGAFTKIEFDVSEVTAFGIWKEPDSWAFPIIYMVITAIIILLALVYTSSIIGVLGSVMIIFLYFLIGATSPLLFLPLLIVGLLLTFKFATLD